MGIFRVEHTKNYTLMSNAHFKEKEMSLKAKGLLSFMLSLPDSWDYSINGLVAVCKENETAIKSTLNELKQFGYLEVIKVMPNESKTGRIEYIYNVYETPKRTKQGYEKQGVENLGVEFQGVENQGQIITKEKITKKLNTDNNNIYIVPTEKEPKTKRFVPPTVEEVKAYCKERNNNIDAEYFIDYYEARNWELSKGRKIKDWKACVRTWEKNSFSRGKQKSSKIEIDQNFRDRFLKDNDPVDWGM